MRISIYQLKPRYQDLYKLSFDEFKAQSGDTPSVNQYDKIFTGVVDDSVELEDLFDILSNDLPDTYKGKDFGVSDIIGIETDGDVLSAGDYYYCDNVGWNKARQFLPEVEESLIESVDLNEATHQDNVIEKLKNDLSGIPAIKNAVPDTFSLPNKATAHHLDDTWGTVSDSKGRIKNNALDNIVFIPYRNLELEYDSATKADGRKITNAIHQLIHVINRYGFPMINSIINNAHIGYQLIDNGNGTYTCKQVTISDVLKNIDLRNSISNNDGV